MLKDIKLNSTLEIRHKDLALCKNITAVQVNQDDKGNTANFVNNIANRVFKNI